MVDLPKLSAFLETTRIQVPDDLLQAVPADTHAILRGRRAITSPADRARIWRIRRQLVLESAICERALELLETAARRIPSSDLLTAELREHLGLTLLLATAIELGAGNDSLAASAAQSLADSSCVHIPAGARSLLDDILLAIIPDVEVDVAEELVSASQSADPRLAWAATLAKAHSELASSDPNAAAVTLEGLAADELNVATDLRSARHLLFAIAHRSAEAVSAERQQLSAWYRVLGATGIAEAVNRARTSGRHAREFLLRNSAERLVQVSQAAGERAIPEALEREFVRLGLPVESKSAQQLQDWHWATLHERNIGDVRRLVSEASTSSTAHKTLIVVEASWGTEPRQFPKAVDHPDLVASFMTALEARLDSSGDDRTKVVPVPCPDPSGARWLLCGADGQYISWGISIRDRGARFMVMVRPCLVALRGSSSFEDMAARAESAVKNALQDTAERKHYQQLATEAAEALSPAFAPEDAMEVGDYDL